VLTTAIDYGIMSNLYCRASASLKAQVGGHGELLKVIATEKIAKAEQKSYVRSQTDGMLPQPAPRVKHIGISFAAFILPISICIHLCDTSFIARWPLTLNPRKRGTYTRRFGFPPFRSHVDIYSRLRGNQVG